MSTALSKGVRMKWLLCICLSLLIMLIPTNETFTFQMKTFIALTLFAIMLFGFELVDTMVGSLILFFGYIIFQVAPMDVVLKPLTQENPWIMLGSFILVEIVQRTTLLKRIAYFCIIKTGGSYTGLILGIMLIGAILSVLVPSVSVVISLFAIAYGLCKTLNLGVSKASAGIMIAAALSVMDAYYFVYSPAYIAVLYAVVNQAVPVEPNYITYFLHNAIFVIGFFIKGFIIGRYARPKEGFGRNNKVFFIAERDALGKISKDEKKILAILLLLMVYLFTYSWHGQSMLYGFIVAPILLYLPGINVGTSEDIRNVNYPTVFFIAACMAIGEAATYTGIGEAFSSVVYPLLENTNPFTFLGLLWIIIVCFNFLMTPAAEMATFGVPFAQISMDLGINVYPMMYTFFQGGSNLLFPYEAAMFLVCFGFGMMKMKDFSKIMGIKMVFDFVFLMAAGIPYWMLIGIL